MQFDFTMAGYGSQNIETAGRFVKYVSGTGQIRVRFDKGGYIDLLPGQGCTGLDFSRLTVEDRSGAGNVGVLLAGSFMFQDDRISGTVDVVDGGKSRTLANQAFMGYAGTNTGSTSGNYVHAQLWNPVGSGVNLIVEQMLMYCDSGSSIAAVTAFDSVMLANLRMAGFSKLATGAAPKGNLRYELKTTRPADGLQALFLGSGAPVQMVKFTEPVIVTPGRGLSAVTSVASAGTSISLTATYEWYEAAI